MPRIKRVNRYCIDCKGRLVYYPTLSNPKAANEHRILVYACPDCTVDFEKPKLFAVRREKEDNPIEAVELLIKEERKKLNKTNSQDQKLTIQINNHGT